LDDVCYRFRAPHVLDLLLVLLCALAVVTFFRMLI